METLVDSSVLVSAFNQKDALHERALKVMDECPKPFVLHEYVVLETATVLMTRADKWIADAFVQQMMANADSRLLLSSEDTFLNFARTFLESKTKLSFTDTTLLALSGEYNVMTFDKALQKAIQAKQSK